MYYFILHKGKFKILQKVLIDFQTLIINLLLYELVFLIFFDYLPVESYKFFICF